MAREEAVRALAHSSLRALYALHSGQSPARTRQNLLNSNAKLALELLARKNNTASSSRPGAANTAARTR